MTPFSELPQWMDLGPDQDFAAPTANLVDMLKKRMRQKPQGDLGAGAGGVLNESPAYSDVLSGSIQAPTKGVKSL